MSTLEDKAFLILLIAASLGFGWIVWPFAGAILWAVIAAVLFAPLNRRLTRRTGQRRSLAAVLTVLIVLLIAVLPLMGIGASLVDEAAGVYDMVKSGDLTFAHFFQKLLGMLPDWALNLLDRFGLTQLPMVQQKISAGLAQASKFLAGQAVNLGQNTFEFLVDLFVMLYLMFFLLRDGEKLIERIKAAIPLRIEQQQALFGKFSAVVRATIRGGIVIAVLQGFLGGVMFWLLGIRTPLLWAVLMAVLSLLPAVGAGLVWLPVAVYLLVTGAFWEGVGLIAYGTFVIGLVDNVLRPVLVGSDIKMPDYVVLISTLGGIELFGMNGVVLGPIIAAMFFVVWDMFATSRQRA